MVLLDVDGNGAVLLPHRHDFAVDPPPEGHGVVLNRLALIEERLAAAPQPRALLLWGEPHAGLHVHGDGSVVADVVDDALDPTIVSRRLEEGLRATCPTVFVVSSTALPLRRHFLEHNQLVQIRPLDPLHAGGFEVHQGVSLGIDLNNMAAVERPELARLLAVRIEVLLDDHDQPLAQLGVVACFPLRRVRTIRLRHLRKCHQLPLVIAGNPLLAGACEIHQVVAIGVHLGDDPDGVALHWDGVEVVGHEVLPHDDDAAAALARIAFGPTPAPRSGVVGVVAGAARGVLGVLHARAGVAAAAAAAAAAVGLLAVARLGRAGADDLQPVKVRPDNPLRELLRLEVDERVAVVVHLNDLADLSRIELHGFLRVALEGLDDRHLVATAQDGVHLDLADNIDLLALGDKAAAVRHDLHRAVFLTERFHRGLDPTLGALPPILDLLPDVEQRRSELQGLLPQAEPMPRLDVDPDGARLLISRDDLARNPLLLCRRVVLQAEAQRQGRGPHETVGPAQRLLRLAPAPAQGLAAEAITEAEVRLQDELLELRHRHDVGALCERRLGLIGPQAALVETQVGQIRLEDPLRPLHAVEEGEDVAIVVHSAHEAALTRKEVGAVLGVRLERARHHYVCEGLGVARR
mmetsp:Transcript_7373/g.20921  ORF Transcript_7373/g.20921 Transcript_7373/m.20921 type:complete len:635 (-) Transcript_7373:1666-3570(-)